MVADERVRKTVEELGNHLLAFAAKGMDSSSTKKLLRDIKASHRIFVYAAGRSGMIGRCFAQRLMHIGLEAYFIGETLTPSLSQDDLLIAVSGSGVTTSTLAIAKRAKELGAKVVAVTAHPDSPLGKLASIVVPIKGKTKLMEFSSYAPFTSQFDVTALSYLDGIVSQLMADLAVSEKAIEDRHATVE